MAGDKKPTKSRLCVPPGCVDVACGVGIAPASGEEEANALREADPAANPLSSLAIASPSRTNDLARSAVTTAAALRKFAPLGVRCHSRLQEIRYYHGV